MTTKLDSQKVNFFNNSWLDKSGRVFRYNGNIYRAITSRGAKIAKYVLNGNYLENLISQGLIETKIADLYLDGYEAVLEHKTVEFISYPQEWTIDMLQEAAIMFCRLNIELMKIGLCCKDSHPWNITYDSTHPIFLDFGSLEFINKLSISSWISEFERNFYLPLWIASKGKKTLARYCLMEHTSGFSKHLFANKIAKCLLLRYRFLAKQARHDFRAFLKELIVHLQTIQISPKKGVWSNYKPAEWKKEIIAEILKEYNINSVIDLAANQGEFSIPIAEMGIPVVATDTDEYSVSILRNKAHKQNLKITPLLLDYIRPTKPFGVGLFYEDSYSRLAADMSMSLGIVHHLVFKSYISYSVLETIVFRYTKRFALIEFIPKNDKYVAEWIAGKSDEYKWYNRESFLQTFFNRFELIKNWKCPYNEREIFLFMRKE